MGTSGPFPLATPLRVIKEVFTHVGTCCGEVKRGEAPLCMRIERMLQGEDAIWCILRRFISLF